MKTEKNGSVESSVNLRGKTTQKTTQKILAAIERNPSVSRQELALFVERTPDAVKKQLEKLKRNGAIRRIGPDKGGHWEVLP